MTYSEMVQKDIEGIGAFDWPEGAGARHHKICVTCTILFDINAPMPHHVGHLLVLLYDFKLMSLL